LIERGSISYHSSITDRRATMSENQ
jgi:hypothetical protein